MAARRAGAAAVTQGDDPIELRVEPLRPDAFAAFGEVIEAAGAPSRMINDGRCARYDNLARLKAAKGGRIGISVFRSTPARLPYRLEMMERHPLGSQAFIPMAAAPFLAIAAPDLDGAPGTPRAFLTMPGQGVNYRAGVWHGVLTPLEQPADFAVIDRIGKDVNLEERRFRRPYLVML